MDLLLLDQKARGLIGRDSDLVRLHLDYLKQMVAIDSRSFGVGEFESDRKTLPDMMEILTLAEKYLRKIGFPIVKINTAPDGGPLPNPILMGEIKAGENKPTLLFYAHLDKQPYMDDGAFRKWGGVSPTELRWNEDRTRLYGRGAADDLAGVTAIGMTVDAILKTIGFDPQNPSSEILKALPCNLKVIYETEEESGSHTLIEQIEQNREFFAPSNCVLITDVINPAQGYPALTTSLRGIIQAHVTLNSNDSLSPLDAQTALYKLLASLIHDDHSLAIEGIAAADTKVTLDEERGYQQVPTSLESLKNTAGLLTETRLTVKESASEVMKAQLRKSFVNVRPGNRVSGSVLFGTAGARLSFVKPEGFSEESFRSFLKSTLQSWNHYQLKLSVKKAESSEKNKVAYDIVLQSAVKDPHSGMNGGPFPIAELQLAQMIDRLIDGKGNLELSCDGDGDSLKQTQVNCSGLFVDHDLSTRLFEEPLATAIVEIRLAPGNDEKIAYSLLKQYLEERIPEGFALTLKEDKGASPWITKITHPAFSAILESLEIGYGKKPCLYGCGGSIPFVPKLTDALGKIPPLCLGAYDPDSRMHEPGESMSLVDWMGCARSMIHFITLSATIDFQVKDESNEI